MAGKRRNDTAATAQVNKKSGTEVVRVRPRTRLVAVEEERMRKEKEAKENEPRRSNRDHDVSPHCLARRLNYPEQGLTPPICSIYSASESRERTRFTGAWERSSFDQLPTLPGKR